MGRLAPLIPFLPVLTLWVAVCAIALLVVSELGFRSLKKHPFLTLVLLLSLGALPLGGMYKVARPYKDRVMAMFRHEKSPTISGGGCSIFPQDNVWNRPITDLPVDANSETYLGSMGAADKLHADFGAVGGYRFALTDGTDPVNEISFESGESDRGPYRIPDNAPVEEGSDGHVLTLDTGNCRIYELFAANHLGGNRWSAGSGAIFDLRSNALRPAGWTSADAAGTSILAGLVRYDEVESGHISHALRFTTRQTRRTFIWPARHYASSSSDGRLPPMGQRFRLKASVDISGFSAQTRVILAALKQYGMILSDNGGNWYISGTRDSRWASSIPGELASLHGSDLEAIDESSLMLDPDSAHARQ